MNEGGLVRLLEAAGQREAPAPERARRVRTALHQAWRGEVRARRRRRALLLGGAAALAAAIAAARLAPAPPPPPSVPVATVARAAGHLVAGEALRAGRLVEVPRHQRASLDVNGLSLRLDGGSLIRLPAPGAIELLRGALYVDAGSSGHTALAVQTPRGELRHLGTQFEARLLRGALRLRVREGRVELRTPHGAREVAEAGDELLATGRGVARRPVAGHGPDWAWVAEAGPGFALEGSTLRDFLAWTAREQGLRPRFGPGAERRAGTTRVHGSLAGLAPAEALAAVMPTTGLRARAVGEHLVVD